LSEYLQNYEEALLSGQSAATIENIERIFIQMYISDYSGVTSQKGPGDEARLRGQAKDVLKSTRSRVQENKKEMAE
jgi:hypothetical protein